MRTKLWLGLASTFAMMGGLAHAQQAPTVVDVGLGPAVADRSGDLGSDELEAQQTYLRTDVARSLARASNPPVQVKLQIVDIEPNMPTSNQLGLSAQLSASSHGLGGAAITGEVVLADGARVPVRYRWFQEQLRNETNFTVWGDADDAFDNLAALIGSGHVPNDPKAWPPAHQARALTGTRIPG